ncbi:Enamine deaminase RidA, house cleaning of reactive enamine intermediates, YjgF/YER057c/UK114 family [Polaromonas sp. OV174]|uniref:RidA family protein n=1 Tax=Polaromonas sp. OV174 TaxID=1855300 RepID=UPI0008F0F1AA|nr:RidA family protein [Polaromonas sp. OV174]SFC73702.1 Enamine deaminase RidA, house cleaning of reactive enamine intermediates, YjgF/YER057c/UK114 family [Polaromonas sp. OV174]
MSQNNVQVFGTKNPNLPFHPAIRAGDFVFLSGQVAKDENGKMVTGSIEDETHATIKACERILALAGCTLDDVVKATVFLEDGRDFGRYNGVFKEYFPEGRLARSTVEARAVITTRIEIEMMAYKPLEK